MRSLQSPSHMSILLFILMLSMVQSYISPLTPSISALSPRTRTKHIQEHIHQRGFGHVASSPFEKVTPFTRQTALNATRKRDILNKTYRKALTTLTKFTKLSQILLLSLTLVLSSLGSPANAASSRSGGRMGGSFSRSSPPSYSRSSGLSSSRMYSSSPMSRGMYNTGTGRPQSSSLYYRSGRPSGMAVTHKQSYVVPLIVYGSIFYVNYQKRKQREDDNGFVSDSPLGPGISVVKFSVAMDLPDRNDPNGILSQLKYTSETSSIESRTEVSSLIQKVCKDLLQQQSNFCRVCQL